MRVAEYFAGIGLARLGLELAGLKVTWSNDMSPRKKAMYSARFGPDAHYHLEDVTQLSAETDPQAVDVAWASFPCTDLSLAGGRGGLNAGASAAFWGFIGSLRRMGDQRPPVVALENVLGLATSHGGEDILEAVRALNGLGYSVDVLRIDASQFVPQSRARLFLIGDRSPGEHEQSSHLFRPTSLDWLYDAPGLNMHRYSLPPAPAVGHDGFDSLVHSLSETDHVWWDADRTDAFVSSLTDVQLKRLNDMRAQPRAVHRTAYRRMRQGVPRWELRADEIAGCLRTARGGSSRQAVVRAGRGTVAVRWMTTTEYAALMGANGYRTAEMTAADAQWGFGDAVCVPVVEWLAINAIRPRLANRT